MKRILLLAATLCTLSVSAQNYRLAPLGDSANADGTRTYLVPQTTLYVQLTVQHESIQAGIYARFAQRFFGTAAVQSDRENYTVIDAKISEQPLNTQLVAPAIIPIPYPTANYNERTASLTLEAAATEAAKTVFDLRRKRIELIGGDIGEHIYGEGLRAALDEMMRLEKTYLALFYGSQTYDIQTFSYTITPVAEQLTYILCRFNPRLGILTATDPSGEPITLVLTPAGDSSTLYPLPDKKDKKTVYTPFQIADNTIVNIIFDNHNLTSATIPIFQLGSTISIPK